MFNSEPTFRKFSLFPFIWNEPKKYFLYKLTKTDFSRLLFVLVFFPQYLFHFIKLGSKTFPRLYFQNFLNMPDAPVEKKILKFRWFYISITIILLETFDIYLFFFRKKVWNHFFSFPFVCLINIIPILNLHGFYWT